jgi:hypothetical protein
VLSRNVQCESRFAGAPWASERQEADVRSLQEIGDVQRDRLSPQKGRWLQRQIVGMDVERFECRKVRRQFWVQQLEDPFRLQQIAQAVLPQIPELNPGWEDSAGQLLDRLGQQDLTTVPG